MQRERLERMIVGGAARVLAGFAVAGVIVAACSNPEVETERADVANGPAPTIDVPSEVAEVVPTEAPESSSPATAPTTTAEPPASTNEAVDSVDDVQTSDVEPGEPSLSVGDELFPDLGSSDVDVSSYNVRLTIDPNRDVIDGVVTVDAEVSEGVTVLPLDQIGLDVRAVTVDGDDAMFETTETELLIDLPTDFGPSVTARIDYSFDPAGAPSLGGLPVGWFTNDDTDDAYVLNQPDGARTWMPSNDHPSDKATWTFELTVPEGTTAVANGEMVAQTSNSSGDIWIWSEMEPMPTYLVQVIVGDYDVVTPDPVTTSSGRAVPIIHVVPRGDEERYAAAFETVADQLDFFEARFGPYPLERYGLAFVRDLSGLAMETQGRSLFGAEDFETGTLGFVQHLLLAHELAHQWFGNAVSPAEWSDIWLNESLTTYAQWLWLDEIGLQPLDSYARQTLDQRQFDGESTGEPSLGGMFNFLRYDGGATVVHALRLTVGDDAFFELMSAWVAENVGTSQTTETFIALAERVHGSDLAEFFDDWLYAGDLPDAYPA